MSDLFTLKREPGGAQNDKLRLKCVESGLSEQWEYIKQLEARIAALEKKEDDGST